MEVVKAEFERKVKERAKEKLIDYADRLMKFEPPIVKDLKATGLVKEAITRIHEVAVDIKRGAMSL